MKAMQTIRALVAIAGLSVTSLAAFAHHSSAGMDRDKPVTFTGTISEVEWVNPHIRFHLDVKNEQGKIESWNLGWGAPAMATRSGLTKEMLKAGTQVTIQAYPFRPDAAASGAGTKAAEAGCVVLNGQQFKAGYGPPCADPSAAK
jgi:hypothetical protein